MVEGHTHHFHHPTCSTPQGREYESEETTDEWSSTPPVEHNNSSTCYVMDIPLQHSPMCRIESQDVDL